MQAITIKNFKSYHQLSIRNLNPNINVIIGANGQGKSNFFKALMFALSDRLSLNQTELNSCMHRGVDSENNNNIQVQIFMEDRLKGNSRNRINIRLTKLWTPKLKQELYIDNKHISRKQYESHIETLSLSYTSPYNIVQQGKISQITLMDEFQLYRLIEEVTGIKKFHKRKQQALQTMSKVRLQKQQIESILKDIKEKLQFLENRKEQFEYFTLEEKTKKYRTKKHLQDILESTKDNLSKLRQQFSEILGDIAKIQQKRQILREQTQQNSIFIEAARQKYHSINKQTQFFATQQTAITQQPTQHTQKALKKVQKKLNTLQKQMNAKNKQLSDFKYQHMQLQKRYQKCKMANQMASNSKQGRNKIIKAYEDELKIEQMKIEEVQRQEKKIIKQIQKNQTQLQSRNNLQTKKQYQKLQQQFKKISEDLKQIKQANRKIILDKNNLQLQINTLQNYCKHQTIKIRKILPFIDYQLIQIIQKQNIKGVYGYFIDFLHIDQAFMFAYQIAGINKLCSLLVQDQKACNQVIKLNQKLKGRQINIIQMSYIRKQQVDKKVYPKGQKVQKIVNSKWIKPKTDTDIQLTRDLQKLIAITFGKYVVVGDYDTGLAVSKQYYLNCITSPDQQTIYADGYLCKVGKQKFVGQSKIMLYNKYSQKISQLILKKNQFIDLLAHQQDCTNRQKQLIEQSSKLENKMRNYDYRLRQVKQTENIINNIRKEVQTVRNMKDSMIRNRDNKRQHIKNMKKPKNREMSREEIDQIEKEYNQKNRTLKKLLMQTFEIQTQIQNFQIKRKQLVEKIQVKNQIKQEIPENEFAKHILEEISQKQRINQENMAELEDLEQTQNNINNHKVGLQIKMTTYQEQYKDLIAKIHEIGQLPSNIQSQIQQMSNSMSMSVSRLSAPKKNHHHFSTNDKILFSKYASIIQTFQSHKNTYDSLLQAQDNINRVILEYENDAQSYMTNIASKFQRQFQVIFQKLVSNGFAQVRFKKVSEKIKGVVRYKSCLSIRVSFSGDRNEAPKKWTQFSGGQKTIVAIAILLTIQRCEPAPFYIFDQIDSALDSMFVRKILNILAEQSTNNNTQYFITSFKQDMLNFDQDICNYYLVKCQNRISSLQKISQQDAKQALKYITLNK